MDFIFFISKKLYSNSKDKFNKSAKIVKLSIASITLSIILMLLSVSVGVGFQKEIQNKVAVLSGHIQIKGYDNNDSYSSSPIELNQNFYPKFSDKSIKSIVPFAFRAGIVKSKDEFDGVVLKGYLSDFNSNEFKTFLKKGTIPKFNTKEASDSIIISQKLANSLKIDIDSVLQMYFLRDNAQPIKRNFIVSGIFASGIKDFDSNVIIGDLRHIQKINRWNEHQVGGFEVTLKSFKDLIKAEDFIYKNIDYQLNTSSVRTLYSGLIEWIEMFDTNIYVIIIIMITVSLISILVVLLVLVIEQIKLIGTLKALGAPSFKILLIFWVQASKIILKSLFYGNLIGLTLLLLQKHFAFISLNPDIYNLDKVPVDINVINILIINFSTIIFCFIVLLIPQYMISKISPNVNLKDK